MSKTADQIKARIREVEASDFFGAHTSDLLLRLSFDDARAWLKPEATREEWDAMERKAPLDDLRDYLPFAWGKANDCRGLSAQRSLDHIKAWLWLAGFDDVVEQQFETYSHYGKRQLVIASLIAGFDWKAHDSGEWVNSEDGPSETAEFIERQANEAALIAAAAKQSVEGTA